MKQLIALILFLHTLPSFAQVRVAFFEAFYPTGARVELIEGGQFFHVAIYVGGKWYHASPQSGVTVLTELNSLPGIRLVEVLEHKGLKIRYKDIKPFLNLNFDYTYTWDRPGTTYCSKFIAQLLDVKPTKMNFSSSHWQRAQTVDRHGLGISPDYLFEQLIEKGFEALPLRFSRLTKKSFRCSNVFSDP